MLDDRSARRITAGLEQVHTIYKRRGFQVVICYLDPEFKACKKIKSDITALLNTTGASEHVPEVERQIRVIKERVRAVRNSLPYNIIPKLMIGMMVRYVVSWLNNFPSTGGISATASP